MRLAILTLPLHTNYGGILQCFALQTVLERMGHDVGVFNKFPSVYNPPFWKYPFLWAKRLTSKILLGRKTIVFQEQHQRLLKETQNTYTRRFVERYIHEIQIENYNKIKQGDIAAVIVGSDQIWRKKYYNNLTKDKHTENSFLAFTKDWNIKRVAYAPSFGTDEWEMDERETHLARTLLKRFDRVSVRETSGIRLCEKHFSINAEQVLDPTLLLDASDYLSKIDCSQYLGTHKSSIMCYVLDETEATESLIHYVSKKLNLAPNKCNVQVDNKLLPLKDRIQPPVEKWLAGFADADYVITDSFHACVFSILFKKPFIIVGNPTRGQARFESLLQMFNLKDQFVFADKTNEAIAGLKNPINWDLVYEVLFSWRHESFKFLENSLKDI